MLDPARRNASMTDPGDTLAAARFGPLLEQLAARTPAPGGGAAASMTAGIAAALAGMVISYSIGAKGLDAHEAALRTLDAQLRAARQDALELADEDAAAFRALQAMWKLPADDPGRTAHEPAAVIRATEAPARVLDLAARLAEICRSLKDRSNPRLVSDLVIAAILADAAAHAAAWNIRINLPGLPDEASRVRYTGRIDRALRTTADARRALETHAA